MTPQVPAASSLAFYFSFALASYSKRIPFGRWKNPSKLWGFASDTHIDRWCYDCEWHQHRFRRAQRGLRCCSTSQAMTVDGRNPAPGGMMVVKLSNAIPCLFPLFVTDIVRSIVVQVSSISSMSHSHISLKTRSGDRVYYVWERKPQFGQWSLSSDQTCGRYHIDHAS